MPLFLAHGHSLTNKALKRGSIEFIAPSHIIIGLLFKLPFCKKIMKN